MNPKKNPIVFGTLLLTATGLFSRVIGFFYRIFISHAFGEEAMGIYQLLAPIITLAFSISCGGIQTAISRYTAKELAAGRSSAARKYLLTGCASGLFLASLYSLFVYRQAEPISLYYLKESRCAPLLRISALSFPLAVMHACCDGYYYGIKETKIPALTQLMEQLMRVGSVFALFFFLQAQGKAAALSLLALGMVLGESAAFLIAFFSLHKSVGRRLTASDTGSPSAPPLSWGKAFLNLQLLALPLTGNRIVITLLQSFEATSIPNGLKQFGYSTPDALGIYGVLTGMALSLILFPSAFTNSASVLLLPMISEAESLKNRVKISTTIRKAIGFCLTLGGFFTFVFFSFGNWLGNFLFDSALAGSLIRSLSFLCPFLYLHTTLSSILHGLGKTTLTFVINLTALTLRIGFVLFFIPRVGINGYLWGLLCSELLSAACCYLVLRKYLL